MIATGSSSTRDLRLRRVLKAAARLSALSLRLVAGA